MVYYSEYSIEKDGKLTIPKVRPEDAGMYTCAAGNELGKAEQPMELVVGGRSFSHLLRSLKRTDNIFWNNLISSVTSFLTGSFSVSKPG